MRWSLFTLILSLCFATAWSLAQADPQDDETEAPAIAAESETEGEPNFEVRARRVEEEALERAESLFQQRERDEDPFSRWPRLERERKDDESIPQKNRRDAEHERSADEPQLHGRLAAAIAEFEVSRTVLDIEMRKLEAKRAEMQRLFRRQQTEFKKAISDLEQARQRIRANMEANKHSIQLLQAQQHDRQRQPLAPAQKPRHPHVAALPHAPNVQTDLHVALQKAVEDLRAEIAALRDEVAELRESVEKR